MKELGGMLYEECFKPLPDGNGKKYLGTCVYEKPVDWIDQAARREAIREDNDFIAFLGIGFLIFGIIIIGVVSKMND